MPFAVDYGAGGEAPQALGLAVVGGLVLVTLFDAGAGNAGAWAGGIGRSIVAIRVVRLGSARAKGEGLRLGTVRRPPRGVPKTEYAKRDFYDVWLPNLAPSDELVSMALAARDEKAWNTFTRKYRSEMNQPAAARVLDLLAGLSHQTNFSLGCYCENEERCHRSVLKELLAERGAEFVREKTS